MRNFSFAFLFASALALPRIADACSFAEQPRHEVDLDEQAVDKEPPGRVEAVDVSIHRGRGPRGGGSTSCDDIGSISLVPTPPSDDRTATSELGYRIRFVSGKLPDGLTLSDESVRTMGDPAGIYLRWIDGATDDQESFDFSITLAAVDRGGNRGEESEPIRIHHGGSSSSGCRTAGGSELGSFALVLGALTWLGRRARLRA